MRQPSVLGGDLRNILRDSLSIMLYIVYNNRMLPRLSGSETPTPDYIRQPTNERSIIVDIIG